MNGLDDVVKLEDGHDFYLGREFYIIIRGKDKPLLVDKGEIKYVIKAGDSWMDYKMVGSKLIGHEEIDGGHMLRFRVIDIELVKIDNKL